MKRHGDGLSTGPKLETKYDLTGIHLKLTGF